MAGKSTKMVSDLAQQPDGSYTWRFYGSLQWTNKRAEGIYDSTGQLVGDCQFSLRGLSIDGVRSRLKRHYAEHMEPTKPKTSLPPDILKAVRAGLAAQASKRRRR